MLPYFIILLGSFSNAVFGKGLYSGVPCSRNLYCDPDFSSLTETVTDVKNEKDCQDICRNMECDTYNWYNQEGEEPLVCSIFSDCHHRGGKSNVFLGPGKCGNPTIIIGGYGEDGYIPEIEVLWSAFGQGGIWSWWHDGYTVNGLFDDLPYIETWPRCRPASTMLNSTMAMVCVGDKGDCFGLDLVTGEWVTLPSLNHNRFAFELVTLGGHAVAIGGTHDLENEIYDPISNKWQDIWPMPEDRICLGCCAVVVDDHHILTIGNADNIGELKPNMTTMLDIDTGIWTPLPPMPTGRSNHSCIKASNVLGGDEHRIGVIVSGGRDGLIQNDNLWPGKVTEFFSLESYEWSRLADSPYSQWGHRMTFLRSTTDFKFSTPVIIGGEYYVQNEREQIEYHQRNFVQTFHGTNNSYGPNEPYCCFSLLNRKRAYFTSLYVVLQ